MAIKLNWLILPTDEDSFGGRVCAQLNMENFTTATSMQVFEKNGLKIHAFG